MPTSPSFLRIAPRSFAFVLGLALSAIGIVILSVGLWSKSGDLALARDGVVVSGTVTDKRVEHVLRQKKGGGMDERTRRIVRYRFNTRAGTTQEGERDVTDAIWAQLEQNGPIAIRYLESDPFTNRPDLEPISGADPFLVIGGLIGSIGLLVFAGGVRTVRGVTALLRDGTLSEGDITAIDARKVRGRTTSRIGYTYSVSGTSYSGKSLPMTDTEVSGWKVGDRGAIRYDPARPGRSTWVGLPRR